MGPRRGDLAGIAKPSEPAVPHRWRGNNLVGYSTGSGRVTAFGVDHDRSRARMRPADNAPKLRSRAVHPSWPRDPSLGCVKRSCLRRPRADYGRTHGGSRVRRMAVECRLGRDPDNRDRRPSGPVVDPSCEADAVFEVRSITATRSLLGRLPLEGLIVVAEGDPVLGGLSLLGFTVPGGTLDDTSWLRPTRHIWTRSKRPGADADHAAARQAINPTRTREPRRLPRPDRHRPQRQFSGWGR
jgi:hypothetical protein